MKKAVVIGGKGKVGTYLVPMLCQSGYQVVNVSRGQSEPFLPDPCWREVEQVTLERENPSFPSAIATLCADVVVDMICFSESDMSRLVEALDGRVTHYLACGSVWAHGRSVAVPYAEEECRTPFGTYGIEKDKMARSLERRWARRGFPGTCVHPGHIVGPGHIPLNPQGNKELSVFSALMHGREVALPNAGMETLHHVHARDVAGVFLAAIQAGSLSYGQDFHAVSPHALTMRGYAEAVAGWFGQQAHLTYAPFAQWKQGVPEAAAQSTWDHIAHSPCASMEKARRLLHFTPRYESLEAIRESLFWLISYGQVE